MEIKLIIKYIIMKLCSLFIIVMYLSSRLEINEKNILKYLNKFLIEF